VHAPMVEALALIKRYKADVPGRVKCYAAGEQARGPQWNRFGR